jgi:hypothetical protein
MGVPLRAMGVGAVLLAGPGLALAQTGQFAGVDSLRVVVGQLGNATPNGLTPDTVRAQLQTWLTEAGIAVDTAEESMTPGLTVGFSIRELPGGWVIGVRLEVVEPTVSVREYVREMTARGEAAPRAAEDIEAALWSLRRNATTWSRYAVATAPTEQGFEAAIIVLRQQVTELANQIVADNAGG